MEMGLRFRDCRVCGERHALRADGLMSIHYTAKGERCEEPSPVARPRPNREPRRDRDPKPKPKRHGHEWRRDPEREAAYALAADRSRAKREARAGKSDRFDRSIYAVKGVHTVSAGLPSHGKRS